LPTGFSENLNNTYFPFLVSPNETSQRSISDNNDVSNLSENNEPSFSKSGGRKRKQYAPRKLASSSANTTMDEDIDVVTGNASISVPNDEENLVVVLNEQNEPARSSPVHIVEDDQNIKNEDEEY